MGYSLASRKANSGMGLLSLLFAVAIIGLMYYFMMKGPQSSGRDSYLKQSGMDAAGFNGMIEGARKTAEQASKPRAAE